MNIELSPNASTFLGSPQLIPLGNSLFGLVFRQMKIVPAVHIVTLAEQTGELEPGDTIIESTSGTFGFGLAIACLGKRYKLKLIADPSIDPEWQAKLEALGATVEIVRTPNKIAGFQGARLERLHEERAQLKRSYWPQQYDNPCNANAYTSLGNTLAKLLPSIRMIVGPVGSGGSLCGILRGAREIKDRIHGVAVDTHGSVLFGHSDSVRKLRGLGNSIFPKNLDYASIDEVHWVSCDTAYEGVRKLYSCFGLLQGPTSGASYNVGSYLAGLAKCDCVVAIMPDAGERYHSSIFGQPWSPPAISRAPVVVNSPAEAVGEWNSYRWDRRASPQILDEFH